ncbi:hypothetical protein HDU76_010315, partial [Blyttiomyces sp. JEL0837]
SGYCGTTADFCEAKNFCQLDCGYGPSAPATPEFGNYFGGYYESWAANNTKTGCKNIRPKDILASQYSYLIYSFGTITPDYQLTLTEDYEPDLLTEFAALKESNPHLGVGIAVGGWTFNDPTSNLTCHIFGNMSADATKAQTFIDSAIKFMRQYNLNGLDIDWEYPAADDRCGQPEDYANIVTFIKSIYKAFKAEEEQFYLTMSMAAGYWYGKHFDVANLIDNIDALHLMAYDYHGIWEPTLNVNTPMDEIEASLKMIGKAAGADAWKKTALGLGYYGHTYAMINSTCDYVGCPFNKNITADESTCSHSNTTMTYSEIQQIVKHQKVNIQHANGAAYVKYDGPNTPNQW